MKTIGLLGGMSWESTVPYYQIINEVVAKEKGGLHSAKILLHSVDFAELETLMQREQWDDIALHLAGAAKGLERAGADLMMICTNTMHKVAPQVSSAINIPLLSITDAVASSLEKAQIGIVALLGTRFTMQQEFYKEALWNRGIEILLPDDWQMQEVDRIIFEELCRGVMTDRSKTFFLALIDTLAHQGAQGIVLGCTEIGLLIKQEDTDIRLFDTTKIHAKYAARAALRK